MMRLIALILLVGLLGEPALAQDGISTLMMNAERPLINEEAAKKMARIVIKTYYNRENFIPSHRASVLEEPDAWSVTFRNKNKTSDLYAMGFQTVTLRIGKKDGCILSVSR